MSYSYFAKHRQALKQSKLKTQKKDNSQSIIKSDNYKIQQSPVKNKKQNQNSFIELSFNQQKTEEQKLYEEYKQMKNKYEEQLIQINNQIQKLRKESQNQNKKVKQAQLTLESKKKQLRATKQRYEQLKKEYQKEEIEGVSTDKITKLQKQLAQIIEKNSQKIKKFQQQQALAKEQNVKLKQKFQTLQKQYQNALQFDHKQFEQQKKKLQEQEKKLTLQLQNLQKQNQKVRKDIKKIQDMKPVSGDIHKRYLDLFQKMFITQELAKAEKIMALKQQQRKYNIELVRRKQLLKQKQKQIQQRQARVAQKNKQVDKLTAEIRQKSTILLTKYQNEADKHKK